jgi:hypothetical protein
VRTTWITLKYKNLTQVPVFVVESLGKQQAEELAVVILRDGAEGGWEGAELQRTHVVCNTLREIEKIK